MNALHDGVRGAALAVLLAAAAATAEPIGTGFTYQGQLKQNGVPVDDRCDFYVLLLDAPDPSPDHIVGYQDLPDERVENGLFTLTLNEEGQFTTDAFTGGARWLVIQAVCTDGTATFPYIKINASPYARHAESAGEVPWAGLSDVPPGFGDGADDDTLAEIACAEGEIIKWSGGGWVCATDDTGVGTGNPHALDSASGGPTEVVWVDSEGDVGIGIHGAKAPLHVYSGDGSHVRIGGNGDGDYAALQLFENSGAGTETGVALEYDGVQNRLSITDWAGGAPQKSLMTIERTGYVGIGTSDPSYELHVVRNNEVNADITIENTNPAAGTRAGIWFKTPNRTWRVENDGALGDIFKIRDSGAGADRLAIDTNGNVGIGTTTPDRTLDILNGSGTSLRVGATADTSLDIAHFFSSLSDVPGSGFGMQMIGPEAGHVVVDLRANGGNDGFYVRVPSVLQTGPTAAVDTTVLAVKANRAVGINTANPNAVLEVKGDGSEGTPQLKLTETESDFARVTLANTENSRSWTIAGLTMDDPYDGFPVDNLNFNHSTGGTALSIRVGANGHGWVGIGTATPQARLDVNGVTRTNVLHILGADVAEKFPTSEDSPPGMVVAIDRSHPGQLCLSRGAYNRSVAGVVSGANGLPAGAILGNLPGSDAAPPIALSGRVWVHCDASYGAIAPSDLLTTSDTPGHAMKVGDHARAQGAILGKAMTSLSEGKGLVLVLVTLQ